MKRNYSRDFRKFEIEKNDQMRIALCSSCSPFARGGDRNIVNWLHHKLLEAGHQVEKIVLPHVDAPDLLLRQMAAYRWVDVAHAADRLICFRPPAHLVPHPNKVVWFIHHVRAFYDLWDSPYRNFPADSKHLAIREILHRVDTAGLQEAKKLFANSQTVADRLRDFNGLDAKVLYPPLLHMGEYSQCSFDDEVVCLGRLENHKRQHMLIEAMRHTTTPVRLRLCGTGASVGYVNLLRDLISRWNLSHRVTFENRWITDEEKFKVLSHCLATAYVPFKEDSYGFASLEAAHAGKSVLTTTDSGGVLELVVDGLNGRVVEPDPQSIADALDYLYRNRSIAQSMGENAKARVSELNISWEHVLERLLS